MNDYRIMRASIYDKESGEAAQQQFDWLIERGWQIHSVTHMASNGVLIIWERDMDGEEKP